MNPFFKVARNSRLTNSEIRNVKGGASSGGAGGAGGTGGVGGFGGAYSCVGCDNVVTACASRRCKVLTCNIIINSKASKGTECL